MAIWPCSSTTASTVRTAEITGCTALRPAFRVATTPAYAGDGRAAAVDPEKEADGDECGDGLAPAVAHQRQRMPVIGMMPTVIPMLTNTWNPSIASIAPATSMSVWLEARAIVRNPLQSMRP